MDKKDLLRLLHPVIRQYIAIQEESDHLYWNDEEDDTAATAADTNETAA
jgi:hypothetical protein